MITNGCRFPLDTVWGTTHGLRARYNGGHVYERLMLK